MTIKARAETIRAVAQRSWNAKERTEAAANGNALPDGSFPIDTTKDVSDAARLYKSGHQGDDPAKTAAHIRARAKALGVSGDPLATKAVAQETFDPVFAPDGQMMVTTKSGQKRYIPYTLEPIAQDVGVPTDTPSESETKVGVTNPEQPAMGKRRCPKCGTHGTHVTCPTCKVKTQKPIAQIAAEPSAGGGDPVTLHCETCGHEWTGDNDGDADDVCPSCGQSYDYVAQNDTLPIVQINSFKKVVTGVVQTPDSPTRPATLGGTELIYPKETIQETAWGFLANQRNGEFGVMHGELQGGRVVAQNGQHAHIVESYIAPCDFVINGRAVAQGSWIVSARITNDDLWDKVIAGEINAFSLVSTDHELVE